MNVFMKRMIIITLFLNVIIVVNANSKGFKFRGGPLESCDSYMIFEASLLLNLNAGDYVRGNLIKNRSNDGLFSFDIGYMKNRIKNSAIGGSFHYSYDLELRRYGIRPRYRYWISSKVGIDISPGLFWSAHHAYKQKGVGKMLGFSLSFSELVSLDIMWTSLSVQKKPSEFIYSKNNIYLGFTGRSYATIITPVVALFITAFSL